MKKRNSYYDVLCANLNNFSKPALAYRNPKAWDNRKAKAFKKIVPRGKVFLRLHKQEWNLLWGSLLRIESSMVREMEKD